MLIKIFSYITLLITISTFSSVDANNEETKKNSNVNARPTIINGVSVPSDFPKIAVSINSGETSTKKYFINNWDMSALGSPSYIYILNSDGTPYSYQRIEKEARDFKIQPNGILTRWYGGNIQGFVGMDSSFTVVDTFKVTQEYTTDMHEIIFQEDGHYFLIALGHRRVDMSQIVSGGNSNARVFDNNIQEFDENDSLVFEWLSKDYFNITDALSENLKGNTIDYVHMNSIAIDYDDNVIISSRHLSEITKIDRKTGEIIWRLGGENNQFTLVNEQYRNSYQHDARPVPGKPNHYTFFDNGNFRAEQFTRAVEYMIDPINMKATKVWEYRHTPEDRYSWLMGNVQRLSNENTLINWADHDLPKITEIAPNGEIVFEANFEDDLFTYRTHKFEWEYVSKNPYLVIELFPEKVSLIFNKFGDQNIKEYIIYSGTDPNSLIPTDTVTTTLTEYSDLENNTKYYFKVAAVNVNGHISDFSNTEEVFVKKNTPGAELVVNGDFSNGDENWFLLSFDSSYATGSVNSQEEYFIDINNPGNESWHVQLQQGDLSLINGREYIFEYDAYSSTTRPIEVKIERASSPWENYSNLGLTAISQEKKHVTHNFVMNNASDFSARIVFNVGNYEGDLYIDNVSLHEKVVASLPTVNGSPNSYNLFNNYPNPFNPSTTITYQIPKNSFVKLIVYNTLGQEVAKLVSEQQSHGKYSVQFDASNLPSGIYIYKLQAGDFIESKKMVMTK